MELLDIKNICYSWGIEVKDFNVLSERATLIISDDDEKFILKKKGSAEQFESELKLLTHLKNKKFSTQLLLYNKFGNLFISYQNANYCIYNYLYGETFSATETLQNSIVPKLLGSTIATLDKAMVSINHNALSLNEIKSIWYVMLCIQTIFMAYFSNNKDIYKMNKDMFLWIYKNKINIENTVLQSV